MIQSARKNLAIQTPIIIVSMYDEEEQIVNALMLGANDYVVKPIRNSELLARITVLLRDSQQPSLETPLAPGFKLDHINKVIYIDNAPINMTGIEYDLANYFFNHIGRLLSRKELLKEVWGLTADIDTRTVDAFIARLRKQLQLGANSSVKIVTLRGYGYRMERTS